MNDYSDDAQSTQEQVNEICNRLYSEGTKPTTRLVLAELPNVSSTSTVHKYFKNWKDEIDANQQSLYDKLGFSTEFTQSFMKEITRFGVEAEQRYRSKSEDANEQRDHALASLEKIEDRFHKQQAVLEQKEKQIAELKGEIVQLKRSHKEELAKANEVNLATVSELRDQLDKANSDNKALATLNEDIRTAQVKAELKLEGYQASFDELKEQNHALSDENKQLNITLTELREQEKQSQVQQSNIALLNKELEGKAVKVKEVGEAKESELREQLSKAEKENKELNAKLAECSSAIARLESTVKGNESLIAQLEKQDNTGN